MPTPRLSRTAAELTKKIIEEALKDGHLPMGMVAQPGQRSAIDVTAERLGAARTTIYNRVPRMKDMGLEPDWSLYDVAVANSSGSADAIQIAEFKDEIKSLKRRIAELQQQDNIESAILQIIGSMADAPVDPPKWLVKKSAKGTGLHVPLTIWSDWHAGEVVNPRELHGLNEFNSQIMEARARLLVERTIHLCRHHGPGNYPGAVVALLGDFISGGLHPELIRTDDLTQMQAALHVRDVLVWALEEMLKEFGQLYVPCTSGNHGRNTHKSEYKGTVYQNFDWLIYEMLIRHFRGKKGITIDNPATNEVHFDIFGKRYFAVHGDMLGVRGGDGIIGSIGPIMRGSLKVGKQAATYGRDYDWLLMGHWHQPLYLPGVIVANTLKGFDEYAAKALRAPMSIPSQPLIMVNEKLGHVSYSEIFLDEPKVSGGEWVNSRA